MNTTNIGNAPTREYKVLLQGNSVVGIVPHCNPCFSANDWTKEDITYLKDFTRQKYPDKAELLIDLAFCESSLRHEGIWGDVYQSYGLFQFQKPTFYHFCDGDWKDKEDQLDCAVRMIEMGLGPRTIGWFNCWRRMNLDKYL